jgi:hypothetical protein
MDILNQNAAFYYVQKLIITLVFMKNADFVPLKVGENRRK